MIKQPSHSNAEPLHSTLLMSMSCFRKRIFFRTVDVFLSDEARWLFWMEPGLLTAVEDEFKSKFYTYHYK